MANIDHIIKRVQGQMSRGQLVLFTGAGFSQGALDRSGKPVPGSTELRDLMFEIAFPGEALETDTSLGEAYAVALRRNRNKVRTLLETRLSVGPDTLPSHFGVYFNLPWYRVYTLNVDDLESAVSRQFSMRRPLVSISATSYGGAAGDRPGTSRLEVVHLNGVVSQEPELVTFSELQYGERGAGPDTWYTRCVADLRTRPVIFVGTLLRESTLWQHVEIRRRHPRGDILPPGSLLVTPALTRARAEMLSTLNIDWLQGTAESFASDVIRKLADAPAKGFIFLETYDVDYGRAGISLVSELAKEHPRLDTEYLMGDEPQWADVLSGRAASRTSDAGLLEVARDILGQRRGRSALGVVGTAGTGKSTALMKLALQLTAEDVPVLWVDRDSRATPAVMRRRIAEFDGRVALLIDDADLYGANLVALIRDLVPTNPHLLFAIGVRANRLDPVSEPLARTGDVSLVEFVVPPLTDDDINNLITTLDRFNRLGILKGASATARYNAFADRCGRQLLVAMFEATTGERFEEKAGSEFDELEGVHKFVYSLLCIASSQRHYLTRDEVFLGCADVPGDPMEALQRLAARHVIVTVPPANHYRARHRMIADVVFDRMQQQQQLLHPLKNLVVAIASKFEVHSSARSDRLVRLLSRLTSHGFLLGLIRVGEAREIYEAVESLLADDYHFWLQRGSLEVESGDLRLAEHFLNQARSLSGGDYRVDTEYGYLLMRKAVESPADLDAEKWVNDGTQLLEGVIAARGARDYYPYHILGSQGVAWTSRTARSPDEQRRMLSYYLNVVEQGLRKHPFERTLQQLRDDIKHRLLSTAVHP